MKQFISIADVDNLHSLVAEALELKKAPFAHQHLGKNKTMVLLFFNPSLRTRLSTQKAARNLGMDVMVLESGKDSWNIEFEEGAIMNGTTQEHVKEAARVISRYADVIGIRAFPSLNNRDKDYAEEVLTKFSKYASVPIVNLESSTRHPFQSLADLITIEEHKKTARPKVVLTWAPHPRALPQAVPNSFAEWMRHADFEFVITHPEGYELSEQFTTGVKIEHDQNKALAGADFVYAKSWSSYQDYGKILRTDNQWMITAQKMALTNNGKFMHCLPVRRNVKVTDEVLDSPNSLVIEQAENRIYSAQVVLKRILETK